MNEKEVDIIQIGRWNYSKRNNLLIILMNAQNLFTCSCISSSSFKIFSDIIDTAVIFRNVTTRMKLNLYSENIL